MSVTQAINVCRAGSTYSTNLPLSCRPLTLHIKTCSWPSMSGLEVSYARMFLKVRIWFTGNDGVPIAKGHLTRVPPSGTAYTEPPSSLSHPATISPACNISCTSQLSDQLAKAHITAISKLRKYLVLIHHIFCKLCSCLNSHILVQLYPMLCQEILYI